MFCMLLMIIHVCWVGDGAILPHLCVHGVGKGDGKLYLPPENTSDHITHNEHYDGMFVVSHLFEGSDLCATTASLFLCRTHTYLLI